MINAAIVGLGRWGQNLVNSVQGKSDTIRFVAGVLRHPENAREYAERNGLTLHSDLGAVLADPAIDAIVLATPHTVHAEQLRAAIEAGKPVFTEKPFTLSSQDAQEVTRLAAERNVVVGVGYNWRFQPALQEIRAMLDDGRLGKLLHIEGNFCGPSVYRFGREHWRLKREEGPAGGMTGRGVHVVDAMMYLAGPVDTVYAQSKRLALDYGIDDTTSMLFQFKGGATAYLGTVIATAETWRMQVFGSRGWVEVGDVEHLTTWQMKVCFVDPDNLNTHQKPQVVAFPQTSTERAELEAFADAVAEGRALAAPGGDEEHGVAVMEAILASAETARAVTVGEAGRARPSRRATQTSATSPVIAETKRILKRVKNTLHDMVESVTGGTPKKRPVARKRPSRTAPPASKRARDSSGRKKRARPAAKKATRTAPSKRTRSTTTGRALQSSRRAATKKRARRK
jgi:predicted dehydrogenase